MSTTDWGGLVTRSRDEIGDRSETARGWSVRHARALAAGASLYADQRERGSSADRDELLAAAASAAESVLAASPDVPRAASVDSSVIGELGDRSLHGLAALARGSLGELVVESLLAAGALPRPRGATPVGLAMGAGGWHIAFSADGGDIGARVVVADSTSAVATAIAEDPAPSLVYASSDAVPPPADGVTVVGPEAVELDIDGPTVVDIGLRSGEIDEALLARPGDEPLRVGGHVVDAVPVFALGLIAARAARRSLTTDDPGSDIRDETLAATSDVFVNRGVGQLAAVVTGAKLVVAPVAITTSLARAIGRRSSASVERSRRSVATSRSEIARIGAWYADRP